MTPLLRDCTWSDTVVEDLRTCVEARSESTAILGPPPGPSRRAGGGRVRSHLSDGLMQVGFICAVAAVTMLELEGMAATLLHASITLTEKGNYAK